jgi:hypothetical protein
MALTGELSDLSLAELIEFFCNQRKTGRLKVIYAHMPGYFYIQAGALVDARIGTLSGIEAIYYALTLPNASFSFDAEYESEQRTIHQPWTQVVLEGLRRMDEGISTEPPINKDELPDENDLEQAFESVISDGDHEASPLPMAMTVDSMASGGGKRKMFFVAGAIVVLICITATVVLTNSYAHAESTASIPPLVLSDAGESRSDASSGGAADSTTQQLAESAVSDQSIAEGSSAHADASARLQREREARERERRRAEELSDSWPAKTTTPPAEQAAPSTATAATAKKPDAPKTGPKTVTVQVSYDEAGRVTQASGSDPTALRIARQKRFPSGKPGTTTITIPIN